MPDERKGRRPERRTGGARGAAGDPPPARTASRRSAPGGTTAPPASRRERRKAEARTLLYDTALRLFRSRGYDQTTVQDIADAADTAKGTFFAYFPTKEHVLAAYHREMGRQILVAIEGRAFASAEQAIQTALRECASWAVNDPVMGRLIIRLVFGSDLLLDSDEENEERLAAWMEAHLARGRRTGELRRSLDTQLFVSMLTGVLSSTVTEWIAGSRRFDLEGRVERKVRFLFAAARA